MDDDYIESPMDSEDVFYCKACGEILEEGKAFELSGSRWHLNCFRCNTCGTLLGSDANLLLLGDGSLICNNCTYRCSACGNKIEDLAILTGDQSFCETCFRCRNCKRKIENLRYARTSQGIFCMSCHESVMARRRKRSKAAQAKAREKETSPMVVDKSLPALPANAIPPNAFSDDQVAPSSDAPTELSPPPQPSFTRNEPSSRSSSRPARSPERVASESTSKESGLGLPPPSYRNNRNSAVYSSGDVTAGAPGDSQSFFIPVALDPSPALSGTSKSTSDTLTDSNKKPKEKDYFSLSRGVPDREKRGDSQSSTPHIAFQEKGRQPSSDYDSSPAKDLPRKLSKSSRSDRHSTKPHSTLSQENQKMVNGRSHGKEEFKLQEAPKSKKLSSRNNSTSSNTVLDLGSRGSSMSGRKDRDGPPNDSFRESSHPSQAGDKPRAEKTTSTPRSSQDSRSKESDEVRINEPQTTSTNSGKIISRKQVPLTTASRNGNGKATSGSASKSKPSEDLGASARPGPPGNQLSDTYMAPRAAPPAPQGHTPGREPASSSSDQRDPKVPSPALPRWSGAGDFTMDEDMARILGTDEGSSSLLRRVSNAVRHGRASSIESPSRITHTRSVSEATRATSSPRWPRTPIAEDPVNGNFHDVASPVSMTSVDDPAFLRRRLRNSEQRVAELERQFSNENHLKNLNEKLEEKRKTVSVLDTQTEIMIRQLEVLAGFVERGKDAKKAVDSRELEDSAIKEFVQKLDKLKQSMSLSLQQLHSERDTLIEEKNQAVADRDRALLEFEQLSSKNAQLADMNNDLTHQIQERFKSHSEARSPMNGLGIYHQQAKGPVTQPPGSLDGASIQTGTTLLPPDHEEPVLESGPTVVKINKGQVRKFNWKKGSRAMAQNIAKGVNRTVVAFQERDRLPPTGLSGENIGLPYNMTMAPVESPPAQVATVQSRQQLENSRQGFFGFKKSNTMPKHMTPSNSSTPNLAEPPGVLFGSELAERADYERRQIPCVVTRCIEEVELRGMDIEGIYRKTGGNSQVKMIQDGFDRHDNFDISDPEVDITAVTSVLKQYFRKLPTPLLTFEIYDSVLDANTITNDAEKCVYLRRVFNVLPPKHRDCLEFLMFHLARVAKREKENLMSPKNLAVVFAPTIMRDTSIEREMTDMHAKNVAVQYIIENSQKIFSED